MTIVITPNRSRLPVQNNEMLMQGLRDQLNGGRFSTPRSSYEKHGFVVVQTETDQLEHFLQRARDRDRFQSAWNRRFAL